MTQRLHFAFTLLVATMIAASSAAAQDPPATGTVAGQVTGGENATPIAGAQLAVVGTRLRASTSAEGRFVIRNVPPGRYAIRAQSLGHAPTTDSVTVAADQTATVTLTLRELPYAMAPMVTTALGISRSEKSLGYAVQSISAERMARIPETTVMQALAGQSAGVSVIGSSGRPGAGARITIRGETSFSGNTQPLFVIDGVPVSTSTDSPSNPLGTGSAGSRQMDLDMENIEELTVLRGAAATALYGSRAANGAIVIKTKQGGRGSLGFTYTTDLRYDTPIIEGYVTDWAAGSRGYFCNGKIQSQGGWCEPGYPGTNPETRNNWGPHKDSIPQIVYDSVGTVRFRDVRADFYRNAPTVNSSLRGGGSMGELGMYTFGATYLDQNGINPIAKLDRLNLNANITLTLSKWLTSVTSLQKTRSKNPYNDDSFTSLTKQLVDMPPSTNMTQAWMADGSPVMFGSNNPHFEWVSRNEYNTELTNRWIASQQFSLTVAPSWRVVNNWGLDAYVTEFNRFVNERPWQTLAGNTSGSTQQRKTTRSAINNDLQLITDGRAIGETGVTVSALVGGNLYIQDVAFVEGRGTTIVIPDYYNVGNFATQNVSANLPQKRRLLGAYSQVTADYRDWAFLTLTGRNDWSSTLPTNNNSYFYPSAALGIVFTDALNWHPPGLSYGKLRLSKAKVGNDAPAYSLSTRYVTGTLAKGANNDIQQFGGPALQFPFRGQPAYTQSTQLGNATLRPESTVEDEVGLELRFFEGRVRTDMSLYRKSSYDQIFNVPSSAVSGYTSINRNAGDLRNSGVEITVNGRAFEKAGFSWDAGVNWAQNRSKVLRLAPGVTSIALAGYSWPQIRIMENQPYGVIWGYGWKKNCVAADPCYTGVAPGTLLIGDDGYPIRSDELRNLGTVTPRWTGSFTSDFRYRNLGLSGLVDVRAGGKILNFETQYEVGTGRSILTADRYTWTTHEGVNINTGLQNTVRLFKDQDYYPLMYGFDRHENQIEPAGFVKLRELTLSYRMPRRLVQRVDVEDATVFVTGRNLRVWSRFSLGDPEGDVYGGTNAGGQYFRQFNEPQTRSIVAGLRTSF